jgi:RNA polymerase sigma factor (sigma-70 family)
MAGADLSEIETVYLRDFPRFVRVAAAILRDEERALDVVQDAFATAIRERRRFRREGPLAAWVWRIVVNGARKAVTPRPFDGREPQASDTEANAELRAAVAELPERQRLILFLRYYADLDYRAIADVLGVSTGTVGAALNAAHTSLRRVLREVQPCAKS